MSTYSYSVVAYNYAFDSENKIHSDDVASQYGFKGGLVPGVADFAYLARAAFSVYGDTWLQDGTIEAKFFKPIYHGELTTANALPSSDGNGLVLELLNAEGIAAAAGSASMGVSDAPPLFTDYASVECPDLAVRPNPDTDSFAAGHPLGNYEYQHLDGPANATAEERFVELWHGANGAPVWHPATALHDANRALRANVHLGPWIHTSSRMQLYGAPNNQDVVSLRGVVKDTYEKRGHVMTELDLAMFANQRAVARIEHRAIIRLAGKA